MIEIEITFKGDSRAYTYFLKYEDVEFEFQIGEDEYEYRTPTKEEAINALINDIISKRYIKVFKSDSFNIRNNEIFINTEDISKFSIIN